MPRLSIVISGIDTTESLEQTLLSVLENRPRASEVVVVINHAYADPYELAGEVQFVQARAGAGWTACANLGLGECRAPAVHFLTSGFRACEGWADVAVARFNDPRVAAVTPVLVGADQTATSTGVDYAAGGVRRVVRAQGPLGPCRDAAFFRTAALHTAGGFCPLVGDDLADVDLALRLRTFGQACIHEPLSRVLAAAPRRSRHSAFAQAMYAERLFWRAAPTTGWLRSIAWHPAAIASEVLSSLIDLSTPARLAGRLWGMCDLGRARRYHAELQWLANESPPATLSLSDSARSHSRQAAEESRPVRAKAG